MRQYEKDGYQVYKMGLWSPGPGCHGGCGAQVYLKDGKVAKVEGDEDHPYYQGRLCPRALAQNAIQMVGRRIAESVSKTRFKLGRSFTSLQISFGVSACPEDGVETEVLLQEADASLHRNQEPWVGQSR